MIGALRVAGKDLLELFWSWRGISLLALPLVLLVLVGQLRTELPPVRVLAGGVGPCASAPQQQSPECNLVTLVRELANVDLTTQPEPERAPLERLRRDGYDVVMNSSAAGDEEQPRWSLYVAETEPGRLARVLNAATGLRAAAALVPDGDPGALLYPLSALQGVELHPAFIYFPAAVDRTLALLPMTIALIICFFPFVLAAPTLVRERDSHMLEVLISAPGTSRVSIFGAKCLVPLGLTLVELLLMLFLLETVFALYIKAGLTALLLFVAPAILASTLLGLAVSAAATSQAQTILAAALYFLCLLVLSGFLYPLEESAAAIRWLSQLFPLTFLLRPLNGWMFGAGLGPGAAADTLRLLALCGFYGGLAALLYWRLLKRI